jgi:hypothetical protein
MLLKDGGDVVGEVDFLVESRGVVAKACRNAKEERRDGPEREGPAEREPNRVRANQF